jgi:hypothetical protein
MDPASPHLSTPQLLKVVHRYYPSYVRSSEESYGSSEQYQRLLKARQEASSGSARWEELLRRLEEALPDCRVEDWTALFSNDNCWRARVYLPAPSVLADGSREARAVVVLVSIITPVFVLYSSLQHHVGRRASPSRTFYGDIPETMPYVEKIEPLVRSHLQVQRLPTEVLFTPVPDIQCGNVHMGDAQLIDCLFTDDRW